MVPAYVQLPLPEVYTEGFRAFRLHHPIYQNGNRYTHRLRWFLAEMSVYGLHREEVAREIQKALQDSAPFKYSRTRLRGQADLLIHVLPGAFGNVIWGTNKVSAIIQPAQIPKLHEKILTIIEQNEAP